MSMSTHVVGFKPPDDKWKKMKAIYDACKAAQVNPPEEVEDFFSNGSPDDRGVEVSIEKLPCTKKYNSDSEDGFEIDIKKLPPDVTVIRFYNSW
jgi:hypothetical protein